MFKYLVILVLIKLFAQRDIFKLSASDDRRIQSINSIETCTYGTNKDLVCKKEEIKRNNIIKQYKNV